MSERGYRGISFPFRLSSAGGVAMSTTSAFDFAHINESIEQILLTRRGERVMEGHFGANLDTFVFDPMDHSAMRLLAYEIVEALNEYEPRIRVGMDDVTLTKDEGRVVAEIGYEVVSYGLRSSTTVYLGRLEDVVAV